ncbi:alpha/beta fold hydrolase [Streptomyces longispororuber]|uniref:alpha/beta fold hydrolase n=1 Tax=Streptomyces longispororuber TaxID=68230 RepID=UPI00210C1AE0|nr:alpha/beta hydrolase [Streptomyces longispororuber]MCQ4205930.1 alpha/beta hydrolase [Streptomyces longispororuber]
MTPTTADTHDQGPAATGPLSPGTHTHHHDGLVQRYHVHGNGPVCVVHPGGPGIFWEYLRMPALEEHLTMVYVEPIGTSEGNRLPSHPHGYTRARYSEALDRLIQHLDVPAVHLLGHSHGAFVAAHHALHHPEQLAGVVLYEGAPVTGPEHGAEAGRRVEEFAAKHSEQPGLGEVLAAFGAMSSMASDADTVAVARGVFPSYFADYWAHEAELSQVRDAIRATYISGLDEHGAPDVIDDRAALKELRVPALVIVGRHDVICGPRWGLELSELIPGSRLLMLENSGHFGHIEEPSVFADAVRDFVAGRA